jgi:hypothetical protein
MSPGVQALPSALKQLDAVETVRHIVQEGDMRSVVTGGLCSTNGSTWNFQQTIYFSINSVPASLLSHQMQATYINPENFRKHPRLYLMVGPIAEHPFHSPCLALLRNGGYSTLQIDTLHKFASGQTSSTSFVNTNGIICSVGTSTLELRQVIQKLVCISMRQ